MFAPSEIAGTIEKLGKEAGFDLAGIADVSAADPKELEYFGHWIAEGRAGEMEYLKARNEAGQLKRSSLKNAAPWAKSVIVCALNYNSDAPYSIENPDPAKAWIARYAWFKNADGKNTDYHDAVLARLRNLESRLTEEWKRERPAQELRTWCYVDTGPIVERVFAKYAGIGWQAKNTCVINQELGSWLFLGVILTNIDLSGSTDFLPLPAEDRCGSCTRCIEACPTDAITEPYKLDATRCISYLTIEKRGSIPEELRPLMGRQVFGCDICQDVCPWNGSESATRKPPTATAPDFQQRRELVNPPLEWLASMSRDEFNDTFRGSPIKRAKFAGMKRNVAVAMGNSGDSSMKPHLEKVAADEDPTVAEHAQWALKQLP
jgi:epoxyqueuosine reductase